MQSTTQTLMDDAKAMSDEVNSRVGVAAATLHTAIEEYSEYIRTHEAARIAELGFRFLSLAFSLDDGEQINSHIPSDEIKAWDESDWSSFVDFIPDEAIGRLLLQLPIVDGPGKADPGESIRKHLAVDVAETLGPDWAQAWYRFVVLVTKLA